MTKETKGEAKQATENQNIEDIIDPKNKTIKEKSLWKKIGRFAKKAGLRVVYSVLLLYFSYKQKDTPKWAKRIITGVIAYFIAPLDAVPDLTPFLGFTDDLGILGFGLVTIAAYVNDDVRKKAREKLKTWFGEYDEKELEAVDEKL